MEMIKQRWEEVIYLLIWDLDANENQTKILIKVSDNISKIYRGKDLELNFGFENEDKSVGKNSNAKFKVPLKDYVIP